MTSTSRTAYAAASVEWLLGSRPARVLVLGHTSAALIDEAVTAGHQVTLIDKSTFRANRARERWGITAIAARAEALPFRPQRFDIALASQNLHKFAPGLALPEVARVLKPGGHIAVSYTVRDDGVPWVRRMAAILREVDDTMMRGDYGDDSINDVLASPYFAPADQRDFRSWVPIDRAGMVAMVASATKHLSEAERDRVAEDVGRLYDTSARPPEPLLLPYRVACWRAVVDQSEMTGPLRFEDGVAIQL
ncbi:class I SAM-dependent methyltransferase [Parenemella sanctibonifatiensis]|uniref:Methyltransferase n=1 Tax=Parenemella sanctibonifatiensis TaxID=2016505 RepID=A0A255EMB0_9ACTN|nr:class I SAM-dependent methyltransferase [Parenemella sanctibonifatiensis]OYN92646.1 methyltransferase [Parenemella sanctibonifatiensis]